MCVLIQTCKFSPILEQIKYIAKFGMWKNCQVKQLDSSKYIHNASTIPEAAKLQLPPENSTILLNMLSLSHVTYQQLLTGDIQSVLQFLIFLLQTLHVVLQFSFVFGQSQYFGVQLRRHWFQLLIVQLLGWKKLQFSSDCVSNGSYIRY